MLKESNGKATLKDVYDVVNRLEDKVDKALERMDCRINVLESGQAKMFGGLAVVGAIWSWIFSKLF